MSFDHENLMQAPVQSVQTSATEPRSRQVFYGWWVVLASAIGLFWGLPISVYSFTVFLKPLMQEFHAGRAAISLAFTLHLFAGAISARLAGWLTDRYGSRQVLENISKSAGFVRVELAKPEIGFDRLVIAYR
jgi:MFS family permease